MRVDRNKVTKDKLQNTNNYIMEHKDIYMLKWLTMGAQYCQFVEQHRLREWTLSIPLLSSLSCGSQVFHSNLTFSLHIQFMYLHFWFTYDMIVKCNHMRSFIHLKDLSGRNYRCTDKSHYRNRLVYMLPWEQVLPNDSINTDDAYQYITPLTTQASHSLTFCHHLVDQILCCEALWFLKCVKQIKLKRLDTLNQHTFTNCITYFCLLIGR